jgi:RHS repeat-associated protein
MKFLRNLVLIMIITITLGVIQVSPAQADSLKKQFRLDKTRETKVSFDNLELTIPAGASQEEMSLEWGDDNLVGITLPHGFHALSKPFRFGPHGLQFTQDKEPQIKLKLDQNQALVKLYYINRETKRLELVTEQQIDPSGYLVAKLKHFSDYVPGVTPAWDGNGIVPYMDYVTNGDESINIFQLNLSINSKVFSLPGRGGMDLNLQFSYKNSPYYDSSKFNICSQWYWSMTHYDVDVQGNGKVYLPNGAAYAIPTWQYSYNCYYNGLYQTYRYEGLTVKGYYAPTSYWNQNTGYAYSLHKIYLSNGTNIDISGSDQVITDRNGNQIRYQFASIPMSSTSSKTLISTIIDSLGRKFFFSYGSVVYVEDSSYPVLTKVEQQLSDGTRKTILTHTESSSGSFKNYSFTDALGRTTSYRIRNFEDITSVTYSNGTITQYSYLGRPSGGDYISQQRFYQPGQSTPFRTVNYSIGSCITMSENNGQRVKKYYFNSDPSGNIAGYTVKEETYQSSKLIKRITTDYYQYKFKNPSIPDPFLLPKTITTYLTKSDSSLGIAATISYEYDDWGNVTKLTTPDGAITRTAYTNTSSVPNLSTFNTTDGAAYQDALFKNGFGPNICELPLTKATMVKDPIHNTTQLRQTHYQYDLQGDLLTECAVYGNSYLNTTYTYDSYGNMLTKTDPNGNQLCFEYSPTYQAAYLTKVKRPTGTIISTYDYGSGGFDIGKPTTVNDPNGNTFSYTYDAIGRMTSETLVNSDPKLGITRTITYNDASNIVNLSFGNNIAGWQYGQITYDPLFGKPIKIQRQMNGNWTTLKTITYDTAGRVATEADGMGHTTIYAYDALDRVIQTTYPDNTISTATWDDHTVTKIDANSNKRVENYDLLDHLLSLNEYIDANTPYTTSYKYDSASQLIQAINPKLAATTNTYDNLGRLIETDFPQDGTNPLTAETFTYDNAGNLKTKTNAKGTKTFIYEFFAGYRLQQVIEPDGRTVTNSYDANDNLLTQQTSTGIAYGYTYNARNMVTSLTAQLDGNTFNVGYDYDTFGRMTGITYPNRTGAVSYNYDELDRLQSIPGFVTSCSYDQDSKITDMLFGNGINNHYDYRKKADNVTSLDDKLADIQVGPSGSLLSLNYTYDNVGNIKQINTNNSTNDYYSYDRLNRLTWAGDNATPGTSNGTAWTYDSAGNMTGKQAYIGGAGQTSTSFTYDLANRLWSMGNKTYTNDAAGARIGKIDADTWSYNYDGESRLTQVIKNSAYILDNTYDGSGMKVKEVKNGQTTYYLYLGNNPLVEYTAGDGKYKYFVYAGTKRIAEEKDGVVKLYHLDHLGSTRLVTDSTGAVVASYKFKAFGETEVSSGSFSTEYGFTGKPMDVGSGLSYYGARWYDPETGRFTSLDPAKDGANWYAYCNNNPIRIVDPDGKMATEAIAVFGAPVNVVPGAGQAVYVTALVVGLVIDAAIVGFVTYEYMNAKENNSTKVSTPADRATQTAEQIISNSKKGSINREFPKEWLGKTYKEITDAAKQGDKSAQKAKKLLDDKRFDKDSKRKENTTNAETNNSGSSSNSSNQSKGSAQPDSTGYVSATNSEF